MHRRLTRSLSGAGLDAAGADTAKLQVDLAHVGEYDAALLGYMLNSPGTILPSVEKAASDALRSLLYDSRRQQQHNGDSQDDAEGDDAALATDEGNPSVNTNKK